MSLNLNTVLLAGHLTRDPEIKPLANEKVVASFGLAINRRFKGPDGAMKEECTFIDCEAWGRTAELIGQYLAKGSACFIEGRLKLESWQDKEGAKRNRLKVVAESVQFLGKAKSGGDGGGGEHLDEPAQTASVQPSAPIAATAPSTRTESAPRPRGRMATASSGTSVGGEPPF